MSIVSMSQSRNGQEQKGLEVSPNDGRGRLGRDDRIMASLNEQGMVQGGDREGLIHAYDEENVGFGLTDFTGDSEDGPLHNGANTGKKLVKIPRR